MAVKEAAPTVETSTNGADAPAKVKRTRTVIKLPVADPVLNETTGIYELRMATSDKVGMSINLPTPLEAAIKYAAQAEGTNPNALVREVLAARFGYLILDNRKATKSTLSPEQRKAEKAKKAAQVNSVLEAITSGKLTPELAAQLGIVL